MSRSTLHCPGCNAPLAVRRANGNIRPRAAVEPTNERNVVFLICQACGERLRVEGVATILMSVRKAA